MLPWLDQIARDGTRGLAEFPDAIRYFLGRGVRADELVSHNLGMLPRSYPVPACPSEFVKWQSWCLRQRLLFPITATTGDVIGMQTRALGEKKHQMFYGVSRDVFAPVFGLRQAADLMYARRQVVVVEGMFDYFAVRRAGVENVIALMTSHSNKTINRMLGRYCQRVIVLLDMDASGRDGIDSLLRAGSFEVLAPAYPAHDPADLVQTPGGLALLTALVAAAKEPYGLWV